MVLLPAAKSIHHERERVKSRGQMGCEMIQGTRRITHNTPKTLENSIESQTEGDREKIEIESGRNTGEKQYKER